MESNEVIEFRKHDSWVGTRFGLKPRNYTDPPAYTQTRRFKLETLDQDGLRRLEVFLDEQKIDYKVLSKKQARNRPEEYGRPKRTIQPSGDGTVGEDRPNKSA